VNSVGKIKNKNILLLQGPMGDFFKRLDNYFISQGANTYKIGFNLADYFYSNKNNFIPYKDKKENWESFIYNFLKQKNIDKIFLFGDCRYYQNIAIKIAQKLNIDTFVFEEGYIRPDYVTLEKWGVNNFSLIPRDYKFYQNLDDIKIPIPKPTDPNHLKMIRQATLYYILAYLGKKNYPYYEHHRELNPYKEAFFGIRNFYRKYKYKILEKNSLQKILKTKYFFVPLQTYNDFQVKIHSPFDSIEEFIEVVLNSFAKNSDKYIVFKHHPMDRGRKDYKKFIINLAKKYQIENKIFITYDLHLPTLLKNSLGTITINSTVGLQALHHNCPVKVLGDAIYDIKYLTYQNNLDKFWNNPTKPNKKLYIKFRNYLIKNTQINGNFYGYFNFKEL